MNARQYREVEPEDNRVMLDLWRQGMDTLEIAKRIRLREWQVANQLPIVREAAQ